MSGQKIQSGNLLRNITHHCKSFSAPRLAIRKTSDFSFVKSRVNDWADDLFIDFFIDAVFSERVVEVESAFLDILGEIDFGTR